MTVHDIKEIPYLQLVINEALRLYPPIPAFFKEVTESFQLENGASFYKKQNIVISPFMMQLDEANFEQAMKFFPLRFDQQNNFWERNPACLPFSGGERVCEGIKMAEWEASLWIARLVSEFELVCANQESMHPVGLVSEGTLCPSNPVGITFTRRLEPVAESIQLMKVSC